MPFDSVAQMRFMYAKHPAMARRWMAEEGGHLAKGTPEKVDEKKKMPSPWIGMETKKEEG